jgi:hypothetical protein
MSQQQHMLDPKKKKKKLEVLPISTNVLKRQGVAAIPTKVL